MSDPAAASATQRRSAGERRAAREAQRRRRTQALLEAPIAPTLTKLAAPNIAAMLFTAIMSIAEGYFAGLIGVHALAGLALVFPFVMLTQMLSAGAMGGAISSAIARALGAGDGPRAERLVSHIGVIALGAALTMALLMGVFGRAIFSALGGEGAALGAALAYAGVFFTGCVTIWIANSALSIIRGAGDMLTASIIMGLSALSSAPIGGAFSQGWGPFPELGMAGLALGPILGFGIGACIALTYLALGRVGLSLSGLTLRFEGALFWDVLRVGLVASLSALQTVFTIIIMVGLVGQFGDAALAGYGLGTRLEFMVIPIAFGIGAAMTAMVGANIGAKQRERALAIAWTGAIAAGGMVGALGVLAALAPDLWLRIFLAESEVDALEVGRLYFAIAGPFFGFFALGLALYFASQGAGRVAWPVAGGFLRMIIAVAGGFILTQYFGLGIEGVFIAVAAGMLALGASIAASVWFTQWR